MNWYREIENQLNKFGYSLKSLTTTTTITITSVFDPWILN